MSQESIKQLGRHVLGAAVAATILVGLVGTADARSGQPPWREGGPSRGEDLVVELVTFGPGAHPFSWYGHVGLVIEDTRLGRSRLYNYGLYSTDANEMLKFAMGRLWFWVGDSPVQYVLESYKEAGRDIRIQRLNLPPSKKRSMAAFLANNVLPENRDYLYHHYYDNCSTRIRDIIDRAVDGQFKEAYQKPAEYTFRQHVRRCTGRSPTFEFLLTFLENDVLDKKIQVWDEMFLPGQLANAVQGFSYRNDSGQRVPLVSRSQTYYEGPQPSIPEKPPVHWPIFFGVGLILGLLPVLAVWLFDERWARRAVGGHLAGVGGLVAVLGSVAFFIACFTNHDVAHWNENLYWANPLSWIGVWYGGRLIRAKWADVRKARFVWTGLLGLGLLNLALKPLPGFDQQNWFGIALLLPILAGAAASVWLLDKKFTGAER